MNLLTPFLESVASRGSRVAIIAGGGEEASYADLDKRSALLAGTLRRRGVVAGDRILLAMPLGVALYVALAALWRIGAVVVLPEPALGLAGVRHAARGARPRMLMASGIYRSLRYLVPELWGCASIPCRDDRRSAFDGAEAMNDEAPALISFTSGSTGRPKGIVRSHGFLRRQNACVAKLLRPERDDEVDLVAFPVFVLANLELGVRSVLPPWNLRRPPPGPAVVLGTIAAHGVTRALVPPAIAEHLAATAATKLRTIFTGGGPVFPDLLERLMAALPSTDTVAVYGSTEAEPIAHCHARDITATDWNAMRTGAGLLAGRPVEDIAVRIIGGEIVVTGDHVSKHYLDPTQEPGVKVEIDGKIWHRTGDAGRLDEHGRVWLLGRLDGAADGLFPFAVEAAARYWPGVRRAALIGVSGKTRLAIEGDPQCVTVWRARAAEIGSLDVLPLPAIPLDRRHRSKVDYVRLRQLVAKHGPAIE